MFKVISIGYLVIGGQKTTIYREVDWVLRQKVRERETKQLKTQNIIEII